MVAIAYLVLAHDNPAHLRRLVRRLSSGNGAVFIHLDAKADMAPFAHVAGPNVAFTSERLAVHWGYFSMVEAIRVLVTEALADPRQFERFVLLSGADYPVRPIPYIEEFFDRHRTAQCIDIVRMPSVSDCKPLSLLTDYQPAPPATALARLVLKIRKRLRIRPRQRDHTAVFDGLVPYAGATWWALTRDACAYLEAFAEARPALVAYFRHTVCPDEIFFHTILGNSPFRADLRREVTYADWSAGGASPAPIGMKHVAAFRRAQAPLDAPQDAPFAGRDVLFARKFSDDRADVADAVDRLLDADGPAPPSGDAVPGECELPARASGGAANLSGLLLLLLSMAHGDDARGGERAVPTDALFGPRSFWYARVPAKVALHPESAAYVAEFLRQKRAYYGTVTINTYSYASALYVADDATPAVPVRVWDCQGKGYRDAGLARQFEAVPIPAHARPAKGTDGEMTVYRPSTDTLWEFWQARSADGGWQACWGGRMDKVSASDGRWPRPYGTTATGLPFAGGQITAEELQRGAIRHVMGISLVELENRDVVSWPASRSDGANPGRAAHRIPAGTRFRLDPSVDVEGLQASPVAKTIARAAQDYGFVVWDRSGAIALRAQNADSYTAAGRPDPYPALYRGQTEHAVLEGFPWHRLQFLPRDYGKP